MKQVSAAGIQQDCTRSLLRPQDVRRQRVREPRDERIRWDAGLRQDNGMRGAGGMLASSCSDEQLLETTIRTNNMTLIPSYSEAMMMDTTQSASIIIFIITFTIIITMIVYY